MAFFTDLLEATRGEQQLLTAAPVIGEGPGGLPDPAAYLRFLAASYAFVVTLEPVVWALAARVESGEQRLRRELAAYGEELAERSGYIVENVAALGGDTRSLATTAVQPATGELTRWVLSLVTTPRPAVFLAIPFVIEGPAGELALVAASRLKSHMPVPRAYTYLESHRALDPEFRERLRLVLDSVRTADRPLIVQAAKTLLMLYIDILKEVGGNQVAKPREAAQATVPGDQVRDSW